MAAMSNIQTDYKGGNNTPKSTLNKTEKEKRKKKNMISKKSRKQNK